MVKPKEHSKSVDIERPMASLREAAGIRTYYAGAQARGVLPSTQAKAERGGRGLRLATLIEAAESFGGTIEVRFVPKQ